MKRQPKVINVLTTSQVSYIVTESRTELLKEIEEAHRGSTCNTFKDHELACCEAAFKIIRRRFNLRSRAKKGRRYAKK